MTIETISALIGLFVTATGGVYWFLKNDFNNKRLQLDDKLKDIEDKNKNLTGKINEFEKEDIQSVKSDNKNLRHQIKEYEQYGADTIFSKKEIESELKKLTSILSAQSGTIYLPYPEISNPQGLKIASITPFDVHTSKLYKQLTPFSSIAGMVYTTNKPNITHNANSISQFSKIADMISGYETTAMLTVPIRNNDTVIAVLQLLNPSDKPFNETDLELAINKASSLEGLSKKIDNFLKIPKWQNILHTKETYQNETIMFCDLTSSSILFKELNIESTFSHINRFFEEISNVALKQGAIIDKYMGDGILFRFIGSSADDVINTARLIEKKFAEIKKEWEKESQLFSSIYIRVGIANGLVVERIVGHPQYQAIGIFGQAVNISINLCEVAPRNKHVVIVSGDFKQLLNEELNKSMQVEEVFDIGKAGTYSENSKAYILDSI